VSGGTATIVGSTLFSITNLTTTWTLIQIVLTAPVSGGSLLFYPDTAGSPTSGTTLFMWGVQMNAGTTASQYYRTTTTVYQAPRFDYDPTTTPPTPRGLLIEGGANSLVARSQALNQSAWLKTAATSISETGTGSPANDATSNVLTWTNGTAVGNAYTEQSGLPVSGGQPYTWSVWLKNRGNQRVSVFGFTKTSANAFSGNLEMTVDFSVATPTAAITTSTNFTSICDYAGCVWKRVVSLHDDWNDSKQRGYNWFWYLKQKCCSSKWNKRLRGLGRTTGDRLRRILVHPDRGESGEQGGGFLRDDRDELLVVVQ
jgi:hypothetical protein